GWDDRRETDMRCTTRLRSLLAEGLVLAPGVYNALFARIAERVGFAAIYMTGFGTAARYGYADVGLVTQSEMVENVRYICGAGRTPWRGLRRTTAPGPTWSSWMASARTMISSSTAAGSRSRGSRACTTARWSRPRRRRGWAFACRSSPAWRWARCTRARTRRC